MLNPLAVAFHPGLLYTQKQPPAEPAVAPDALWPIEILELPREVVCLLLSKVGCLQELFSCVVASKQLSLLLSTANLRVNLSAHLTTRDKCTSQSSLSEALGGLGKYMPDLVELDMSGLPVENCDVEQLLSRFANLRVLNLSTCNRLSPLMVSAFTSNTTHLAAQPSGNAHSCLHAAAGVPSDAEYPLDSDQMGIDRDLGRESAEDCTHACERHLSLEALSLQRCFQLNGSVLTSLLHACTSAMLPLTTLAMSHLDLANWSYSSLRSRDSLSRELCSGISSSSRSSSDLSRATSMMSLSLIGSFTVSRGSHLRLLVLNKCNNISCEGLLSLLEGCPKLQMLFLGGSTFTGVVDFQNDDFGGMGYASERVAAVLRDMLASSIELDGGISVTSPHLSSHVDYAACLAILALSAPSLRVLELTFMPQPVMHLLRPLLHACFKGSGRSCPHLWNFLQLPSILAALHTLKVSGAADSSSKCSSESELDYPYTVTDAPSTALALKCAVNCSSASRWTPLHFAVQGGVDALADLIMLGANVNARNHGGATPLFLACECGKDRRVAELLLEAGADPHTNNTAGESPLYISALRGHTHMVKALLCHFSTQQIDWRSASLYSDRWTPLMAACVADRYDVALLLLLSAGTHAAAMVSDVNKYGQNVFHIAARKGSQRLLKLLLCFTVHTAVAAPDTAGETPIDVARKNGHWLAVAEFQIVCAARSW